MLITEYMHHTPGNLRAVIHVKTRNLKTGSTGNMRLDSSAVLETAYLDEEARRVPLPRGRRATTCSWNPRASSSSTSDAELVGDKMGFVQENTSCVVTFHGTTPIDIELPASVVLEVTEAEPAVRGNTATSVKKDAVVETGMTVKVPIHISVGDRIKLRTSDGEFQGRA